MTMTNRPPPRRPGAPPRPDVPSRTARAASSGGEAAGPPLATFLAVVVTLAFVLVSFWLGNRAEIGILNTGREVDFNTLGYVVGCFVSIAVLYQFLKADGKARATRRYSEWRYFGVRKVVNLLTLCSWLLGALHLLFWARDLTRP